jgi:hypothetical protein
MAALATTGVSEGQSPEGFVLLQNYPNPFNPSTKIQFRVASSEFIELRVFDMLGREVATLVNGQLSAGEHEVIWNTEGLATGVYMYRLTIGPRAATKKMILSK